MSIPEIIDHLECLGSIKQKYQNDRKNPLRCKLPGLANAETVDAAMLVVNDYCSFFNYHMLEHIITKFGTKHDIKSLASYKEVFNRFSRCCITQCPSEIGKIIQVGFAELIVTLDDSFNNCTVNHLTVFIGSLQMILNIPSSVALRLCNLESSKLTFQIPHIFQRAIFPLSSEQKARLCSIGIVQICCEEYQFCTEHFKVNLTEYKLLSLYMFHGYVSRKGKGSQQLMET